MHAQTIMDAGFDMDTDIKLGGSSPLFENVASIIFKKNLRFWLIRLYTSFTIHLSLNLK